MWIAIQNAVGARQGVGGGPGPTPPYTPPLDSIDSVAAYSVRKLRTDYSGPCMEVYRVSDGATTDIGFDSQGLLATADIVSFASGSQVLVSTWYNQGTSGPDAVALSGERPEIYTGTSIRVMGGKPALYPQNTAVGFTDVPINISNLQPEPWTHWTNFSVSKAANNFGVFSVFVNPNRRINLVVPFVPTGNDGALQGIAIDTTGTGGIYYQGVDRGTFVTRGDTLAQFEEYQTISNIVALATNSATADLNDMTLGATTYFGTGEYSMHIMQEVMVIPYLSLTGYNQALDINANNYYQITNLPDYTSGFLADYPDAAAAYSVRKLSNTAIKALRVRRTVAPFDEQDIGFTAGGDLDEAAIVAFGNSDPLAVSRWYDQSGFSRHAAQDTPGSQPTIYNGTVVITENGKPAIASTISTSLTVSSTISVRSLFSAQKSTGGFLMGYSSGAPYHANGSFYLSTLFADSAVLNGNNYENSTLKNFTNVTRSTSQVVVSMIHTGTVSANQISQDRNTSNSSLSGTRQELILWSDDQSSNRPAIEENINDYYKIIINDEAATSGFLFDYPNAAAAYSVRQLNNNAEYCMQVERSDGRTMNIGFVAGDLDTQAIIDFAGANPATVSRWYDQSGNQNHAEQTAQANQPKIYNGTAVITENGKPAIDLLTVSTSSPRNLNISIPDIAQPYTFAIAQRMGSNNPYQATIVNGPNNLALLSYGGNQIMLSSTQRQGTVDLTQQRVITAIYDSPSSNLFVNGGSIITNQDTGTSSTSTVLHIGGNQSSHYWQQGGTIQEYILWSNNQQTEGNRAAIEQNINTYYSIP